MRGHAPAEPEERERDRKVWDQPDDDSTEPAISPAGSVPLVDRLGPNEDERKPDGSFLGEESEDEGGQAARGRDVAPPAAHHAGPMVPENRQEQADGGHGLVPGRGHGDGFDVGRVHCEDEGGQNRRVCPPQERVC